MHRNDPPRTRTMQTRKLSFETACRRYVHRFTGTHVPQWARTIRDDGAFYAPQYRDCREWYENTVFPGEPGYPEYMERTGSCFSSSPSWPFGQSLRSVFVRS